MRKQIHRQHTIFSSSPQRDCTLAHAVTCQLLLHQLHAVRAGKWLPTWCQLPLQGLSGDVARSMPALMCRNNL